MDREETATIFRLTPAMGREFDGLVQIYKAALPASERKSPDALRAMLARPDYEFLIASSGEDLTGFAIVVHLAGCEACLLEYMAVDAVHRGKGIGTRLFQRSAASAGKQALLLEVEAEQASAPDAEERVRRKEFYKRLGCREVSGLRYLMPPVTADRPPIMGLFVFGDRLPARVGKAELWKWLECLYVSVYGRSPDDPLIGEMTSTLPPEIPLT